MFRSYLSSVGIGMSAQGIRYKFLTNNKETEARNTHIEPIENIKENTNKGYYIPLGTIRR